MKRKLESAADALAHINQLVDDRFSRNTKIIAQSLESDLLPLRHQAVRLHISESFLYKLHYQGKLPFHKLGSLTYIKSSEIDQLFEKVQGG